MIFKLRTSKETMEIFQEIEIAYTCNHLYWLKLQLLYQLRVRKIFKQKILKQITMVRIK